MRTKDPSVRVTYTLTEFETKPSRVPFYKLVFPVESLFQLPIKYDYIVGKLVLSHPSSLKKIHYGISTPY